VRSESLSKFKSRLSNAPKGGSSRRREPAPVHAITQHLECVGELMEELRQCAIAEERVREIHRSVKDPATGRLYCDVCLTPFPCDTRRAITTPTENKP
jgi:hypothetical protein